VDVENVYGKGVTLRIYLPAAEEEVVETEEASRSARHMGKGETILLVEDNGPLREATRAMLEGLNYRVLSATNGQEALTRYGDDSSIALVITDLVMPVMGGKALMQALRSRRPQLPGLAVTGYTPDREDDLLAVGFAQVLSKPFDEADLARAIRKALRKGHSKA